MKTAKVITWAILTTLIALATLSSTTLGITGNSQPDTTPYVGVVVLFNNEGNAIGYCSGVLISSNVMLTSGHSTFEAASVRVCFDKGSIKYDIQNGKIILPDTEKIYSGTPITYPEYALSVLAGSNKGNNFYSSSDVGLIVLDQPVPVTEVTPYAALPSENSVEGLQTKTNLQVIGYGVQTQITPKNHGVENSWVGTISCNSAQNQLISGNFVGSDKYLKLSANAAQNKGGVAFGDSGGPVIYTNSEGQDVVLGVSAYVSNSNCAGVTYHTRIDSTSILGWISDALIKYHLETI